MPNTPRLLLPYPSLSDTPDVPFWMQQLAETVETKLSGRPRCRMATGATTTAQTLTSGAVTTIDFAGASVTYDTDAMADVANDAIVIKTAGLYRFHSRAVFEPNTTGYRALLIYRGADSVADDYRNPTPQNTIITLGSEPILCAAGDVITARAVQTSGGNLNLIGANGRGIHLAAEWCGGQ